MKKATLSPGQTFVINKFVEHKSTKIPGLKVDRWPDQENRITPDIDAIAGNFAIEHTSVDTIIDGRTNNAYFNDILPEESDFKKVFDFRAQVAISWNGIFEVTDRKETRKQLTEFIKSELPKLEFGHTTIDSGLFPFRMYVSKYKSDSAGVYFARAANFDENSLKERVCKLIIEKSKKLECYKIEGKQTIIIVESEDTAFMNKQVMKNAIENGFASLEYPSYLDEIWFAHIILDKTVEFTNMYDLMANKQSHWMQAKPAPVF